MYKLIILIKILIIARNGLLFSFNCMLYEQPVSNDTDLSFMIFKYGPHYFDVSENTEL